MAFPTIRASSSCQSCRCRCRCRSGPPLGTSCRGGGGIEPDDDDDPSCDGTPVLAHHSGISCWPSIDRSVPPVPRPPPPSGLRANEQTRRGTVPTCSLEAGWRSCWCCSSSSSSHSYALSSSMGISEELLNASIPPSSHPSGPRRPPSQYSHKPVNDNPSRHTHTHTRHTDETQTCTTGGGKCVRAVCGLVSPCCRQTKKRIFGLLVTEASRGFALFCSPFSARLHSVGFWLGCLLAVVTRPWLELHRAKQKKSGETGLEIKKNPPGESGTAAVKARQHLMNERCEEEEGEPKKKEHPGPFLASHAVRQHPPPLPIHLLYPSRLAPDRPQRPQHTAQHRTTTAVRRPRPRPRLCVLSPHLTHSGIRSRKKQPGKKRVFPTPHQSESPPPSGERGGGGGAYFGVVHRRSTLYLRSRPLLLAADSDAVAADTCTTAETWTTHRRHHHHCVVPLRLAALVVALLPLASSTIMSTAT